MKIGTIELTQGAVLYLVLMLVVVFIGIMIVTKGQATILLEQKKMANLFEPGKLTIEAVAFSADCPASMSGQSAYPLEVSGLVLDFSDENKKEGDSTSFFILADTNDRLFLGQKTDDCSGDKFECGRFTCTKSGASFNCGQGTNVIFNVGVQGSAYDRAIHLTVWRETDRTKDMLKDDPISVSLAEMIDENFQAYMGSYDVPGTYGQACRQNVCSQCGSGWLDICTSDECWNGGTCYYSGNILLHSCSGCPVTNICSTFSDEDMCKMCSTSEGKSCTWENSGCRERP